ncbi:MAG: amino acid permease, partial [Acidobacteria bacterium]|nr:amino acid permease [Acidobacteriota bacterium]
MDQRASADGHRLLFRLGRRHLVVLGDRPDPRRPPETGCRSARRERRVQPRGLYRVEPRHELHGEGRRARSHQRHQHGHAPRRRDGGSLVVPQPGAAGTGGEGGDPAFRPRRFLHRDGAQHAVRLREAAGPRGRLPGGVDRHRPRRGLRHRLHGDRQPARRFLQRLSWDDPRPLGGEPRLPLPDRPPFSLVHRRRRPPPRPGLLLPGRRRAGRDRGDPRHRQLRERHSRRPGLPLRATPSTATADSGGGAGDGDLVRALGLWDSTLLVIGLVLGSAVFMVTGGPDGVARLLPAPGLLILGWIAGGVFSFAGALVYAELGAALPRAGGQYVFLREAYGDLTGFLYGWTLFAVIHTGTLAALAVGYAEYFGFFFPAFGTDRVLFSIALFGRALSISAGQINAVSVLVLLSAVNFFGVKEGSLFQGIVTVVKIAVFAGFMILGVALGRGSLDHFFPLLAAPAGAAAGASGIGGFVLAMVAMLWAYEGWNNITFTAGEIRDPQRNIPRSLILGMSAITLIYVGMNLLYVYAMPVTEMTATPRIGEAAAERLFGPAGSWLMSLAVLVSVFGCISATVISGPRVFYAMARDGLFFRRIAEVHPDHRTPARAIVWQGVWSSLLCLSGTYGQLITFVIFAAVLFYALAGASVIVLRRRHPEWPRPYRTWGYPVTPLLYVGLCCIVLVNTLIEQPAESGWGLAILAGGLPAYLFWKRRRDREGAGRVAGAAVALLLVTAAPGFAAAEAAAPEEARERGIDGFHRDSLARQREYEALLLALPDPARVEAHARALTEEPHVAGTPENERVARYIADRFREAGLAVEMKSYSVYMGFVKEALLEQVDPEPRLLSNPEGGIAGDADSADPRAALNWNAYSPSCDLTREVVFVNHARPEDFAALAALGVGVRGRILLARHFKGYRGGKALEARRRGAAAIIFYSDPAEDGHVRGAVYPDGPWGPDSHFQRGATALDFIVPGDPLTPGWPSLPGARRIRPEESEVLPRIPSVPISSRDALVIFKSLAGPAAPRDWQGGLPVTYHLGPGPSLVRLKIDASFEIRPITNVIGTLRGEGEPEKKIILGNHHDAWTYGAVDPSSGTATMIELARVAGELYRRGLKPRRTLVFANWDAEEWTLTGSTEWG